MTAQIELAERRVLGAVCPVRAQKGGVWSGKWGEEGRVLQGCTV